jgi:hypothetical protein
LPARRSRIQAPNPVTKQVDGAGQSVRSLLPAYLASLTLIIAVAVVGGIVVLRDLGPDDAVGAAADRHGYSLASWEMRHLPHKWIYEVRHLFDGRSGDEDEKVLSRYFSLAEEIRALQQDSGASYKLDEVRRQRAKLEGEVEDIIEGRVTAVLEDQGLALRPPLFHDLGLILPAVDFELDTPPRVLAVSPRDRIELDRSYLLDAGLDLETLTEIEQEIEAGVSGVSALVVGTSGVATYPSVVSELASYESLVDTVFHEWLHQYLIFFPLGSGYASSSAARTLNESVANIAGHELARLYFERYGVLGEQAGLKPAPTRTAADGFDFTKGMRELRRRVEALLAGGRIEQAEALMNEKRNDFEAQGFYIRRLNQAYFTFQGSYADTPGSIDPIGPKLQTLLERGGSPGEVVRLASGLASESELDSLLGE